MPGGMPSLSDKEATGDLAVRGVFPEYSEARLPSETRILLVAGESRSPNYLHEITAQREHWLRLGYQQREIACYYAKPSDKSYEENKSAFDALASKTQGFYIASPQLLYQHIRQISRHNPEFVYLYITSTGQAPIQTYSSPNEVDQYILKEHPEVVDQYFLEMDGSPTGTMNERMRAEALRNGMKPENLFLMPRYLKSAMMSLPTHSQKVVVLQGCYTGGFMETPLQDADKDTLTAVPEISLLTASRFDRRSFECGPGKQYTPYGKVFLQMLGENPRQIPLMDWKGFASILQQRVDDEEIMMSYAEERLSYPRFYSNSLADGAEVAKGSLFGQ